ncbi:MAG TPA: hypothetical protein VFM05_05485 [Candidatus Saccharimonadales bacterium]|nr:hypothetical protein [Candidatus Saccharimonadales bacterium]
MLVRTNKDHPRAEDIKALSDLLNGNKSLELWRDVLSAAQYAERAVIENSPGVHGIKECWRLRLASLRNELGYAGAPILEQLLIQDAALSWLKLSILELQYLHAMKQSITLTHGIYWEKRLSAAQRRFTRACETLARVRKLSRNTPALQFNIATSGGQQVNVAK